MRRKKGSLIAIECSILAAAVHLSIEGTQEFHGFRIAKEIKSQRSARLLTGHGTLYRALGRLEKQGYLDGRWEDPVLAARENRPRRKLYKLTTTGISAGTASLSHMSRATGILRAAWADSC